MGLDPIGLVGRDHELAELATFLDKAATDGATVLLTGEPGVGKTALLDATARSGGREGAPGRPRERRRVRDRHRLRRTPPARRLAVARTRSSAGFHAGSARSRTRPRHRSRAAADRRHERGAVAVRRGREGAAAPPRGRRPPCRRPREPVRGGLRRQKAGRPPHRGARRPAAGVRGTVPGHRPDRGRGHAAQRRGRTAAAVPALRPPPRPRPFHRGAGSAGKSPRPAGVRRLHQRVRRPGRQRRGVGERPGTRRPCPVRRPRRTAAPANARVAAPRGSRRLRRHRRPRSGRWTGRAGGARPGRARPPGHGGRERPHRPLPAPAGPVRGGRRLHRRAAAQRPPPARRRAGGPARTSRRSPRESHDDARRGGRRRDRVGVRKEPAARRRRRRGHQAAARRRTESRPDGPKAPPVAGRVHRRVGRGPPRRLVRDHARGAGRSGRPVALGGRGLRLPGARHGGGRRHCPHAPDGGHRTGPGRPAARRPGDRSFHPHARRHVLGTAGALAAADERARPAPRSIALRRGVPGAHPPRHRFRHRRHAAPPGRGDLAAERPDRRRRGHPHRPRGRVLRPASGLPRRRAAGHPRRRSGRGEHAGPDLRRRRPHVRRPVAGVGRRRGRTHRAVRGHGIPLVRPGGALLRRDGRGAARRPRPVP
ncbi:AAA family ATPase [Actinomadura sp. CNU-125]|uniref:AAA family ATPase n=1 Tax=Actinomadura sp. CNU-125 TaxID=1904961 RepID=UPI003967790E